MAYAQETFIYDGTTPALQHINLRDDSLGPVDPNNRTGNTITINYSSGNNIAGHAVGAFDSTTHAMSGNRITMNHGSVGKHMTGAMGVGKSNSGDITNNHAILKGGNVARYLMGGQTEGTGTVDQNTAEISGAASTVQSIYGGYASYGVVSKNTATVSGGKVSNDAFGGYSFSKSAEDNTVTVSAGEVGGNVYGGHAKNCLGGPCSVTGNKAIVSGGTVKGIVYGGRIDSNTGSVIKNEVIHNSGQVDKYIYGGYSSGSSEVKENTVTIDDTATASSNVYGGYGIDGNATGNIVRIKNGDARKNIYGGHSTNGNATGNEVEISGGTVLKMVFGATIQSSGSVSGNKVTVSGGTVGGDLHGGNSYGSGKAEGNIVEISGGKVSKVFGGESKGGATGNTVTVGSSGVAGALYGGKSGSGDASGNKVEINGGSVSAVYGAYSYDGDVTENTVSNSGTVYGALYGGYSQNKGNVTGNTVSHSGTVIGKLYGGSSSLGNVTGNIVYSSGNVSGDLYGGSSSNGKVTGNKVFASSGDVSADLHGGYSRVGQASDNTVTISGTVRINSVYGGSSDDKAPSTISGNIVNINGGEVGMHVYGGKGDQIGFTAATATGNIVNISSGKVGLHVYGGSSFTATGNIVNISGGEVGGQVYGGTGGDFIFALNTASDNIVNISGGKINGGVHGGKVKNGNATGNIISISGAPVFNTDPHLGTEFYGGLKTSGTGDVRTGNTLEMRTKGITVQNIKNFEKLHFYLPNTIANGDTVLTLTNTGGSDITGSKVGVAIEGGSNVLQKGQRVALIHTSGGNLTTDAGNLQNTKGMHGTALIYDFTLSSDSNHLYATLNADADGGGIKVNPQTKSYSEGRLAGLAFVNQGADMASGTGMERATAAAHAGSNLFGAISGGSSRYESGSHVDVKGFSLIAGAATNLPNSAGKLMLGGFFEAGWGNYDSYNSFVDAADVNGKGDNRYYGAGVLARQEFASKFYTEGSVRVGKLENDYSGVVANTAVSYKINKAYYGAHLGAGYVMPLGTGELDMYGKYLWTRQKGGQHTIAGDVFTFEDINSQRTRLGAAYNHPISPNASLKLGAAWEYEFDGKAKASVHGLPITAPEIKGSTAVLEAGIKVSPASNKNLSFEAGVQGYAGKRKGVTGNVAVKYAF